MAEWISREDIDRIIDGLSADDIIEAVGEGRTASAKVAGAAFNHSAERLGFGEKATTRVSLQDFQYMANRIGEVVNLDSPLPAGTGALQDSADTGA